MSRRHNRVKEPTREEILVKRINVLLENPHDITAQMIFDIMCSGDSVWRQGLGLGYDYVMKLVEKTVNEHYSKNIDGGI